MLSCPYGNAIPNGRWHRSTIPLASRHLRAPIDSQLPADHLVAALLCQVLSVRHQALLKTTGQQGPLVLVSHKSEVPTGHADPRTPGPFQTTNKVPPLFHSSSVRKFIGSTAGLFMRTREEMLKRSEQSPPLPHQPITVLPKGRVKSLNKCPKVLGVNGMD